jgi:hypothetical protein
MIWKHMRSLEMDSKTSNLGTFAEPADGSLVRKWAYMQRGARRDLSQLDSADTMTRKHIRLLP